MLTFCTKITSDLTRHKRLHTGEKPYVCTWEDCDWKFARKGQLTVHLRKHTGEKPYKCTICGQAFSQTGILDRHMTTH